MSEARTTAEPFPTSIWRLVWRVSQQEPRSFWLGWASFVFFFTLPALSGYFLGRGFEALSNGDNTAVYRFAAPLALTELVRMATIHYAAITWTKAWVHMQTIVRGNLLLAQMASGGPEAGQPVGSAGEAVTHFRDDTEDVTQLIDGVVDVSGGAVFVAIAGYVLCVADPRGGRGARAPVARGHALHEGARRSDQGVPGGRP